MRKINTKPTAEPEGSVPETPVSAVKTKRIKFMINACKSKIDTHKAAVMILNNKSDHLINTFGITIIIILFYAHRLKNLQKTATLTLSYFPYEFRRLWRS